MIERETLVEEKTTQPQGCAIRDLANQIAAMLGPRSPEARRHLRNARLEVLKAVRSVIDERIDHLSRTTAKGTKLDVE